MVEEEFPVQRLQQRLQKLLRNKHPTRASCLDCGGELSVEVKMLLAFFIVDRSEVFSPLVQRGSETVLQQA
jgi:hypothetical protein